VFGLLTPAGRPSDSYDPDAVTNVLSANPGPFMSRTPVPRADSSTVTVAEAPDPKALSEIRALDPEILEDGFDIDIDEGWEDHTESEVPPHELLDMFSEDDVRRHNIPDDFTGRFAAAPTRPEREGIDTDFESEETH